MSVHVVPYSDEWPTHFAEVASELHRALETVPVVAIEHVGSTAVPGLAAKPVLDIDIIVERQHVDAAISALATAGYVHRGDLGVTDREAFTAPDNDPARHVYLCVEDTLHLRNHLAFRDVLRQRSDLREKYSAVKMHLARDPEMDIDTYIAGKAGVLQEILAYSDLTDEEKALIYKLNTQS
ncbi:GrpB family protein [Corynebacterium hindlerae]|uniref:GrpB family protein n=1 Tax=Corynebacterium hindlerae TaxID=699041 RepID=A0A7G5FE04_9CORY|nr:GrpB family protein [Corynebacterium hindlerae]QMV84845.1 GrpB family protein [Corynebacterium hindlerae]